MYAAQSVSYNIAGGLITNCYPKTSFWHHYINLYSMNICGTGYVLNNCMCTHFFFPMTSQTTLKEFLLSVEKNFTFILSLLYRLYSWVMLSSESWSPAPPIQVIRLPPRRRFFLFSSFVRSFVRDIEKRRWIYKGDNMWGERSYVCCN